MDPSPSALLGRVPVPALLLSSSHHSLSFSNTHLAEELPGDFVLQLEIGDIIKKPFAQLPLHTLHTSPAHSLTLLSPRPMGSSPLPTTQNSIAVSGCNGRQQITVAQYCTRITTDKPEGVIVMADEVAWHMSSKRLRTAVERSLTWFSELTTLLTSAVTEGVQSQSQGVFAVVVGGPLCGEEHVERQIKTYLEGGATGLVVGGVGQGETLEDRKNHFAMIRRIAGSGVPLLVQGVDTLPEILHALRYGIDVVSSDYPRVLSSVGMVISYNFLHSATHSDHTDHNGDDNDNDAAAPVKRKRVAVEPMKDVPILNLWDTKYRKDVNAILPGCKCHCCRLYTRAYLHHLLLSHELLADSMIFVHNRHVMLELFEASRIHMRRGDFAVWTEELLGKNVD